MQQQIETQFGCNNNITFTAAFICYALHNYAHAHTLASSPNYNWNSRLFLKLGIICVYYFALRLRLPQTNTSASRYNRWIPYNYRAYDCNKLWWLPMTLYAAIQCCPKESRSMVEWATLESAPTLKLEQKSTLYINFILSYIQAYF